MPIDIYVDVSSLIFPLADDDAEISPKRVEDYVQDLLFLKENIKSKFINLISAEDLPLALAESGLYPIFDDIKYIIGMAQLGGVYDARDVNRIFEMLFRQMPFSRLPVKECIEVSELKIQPEFSDWGSGEIRRIRQDEFSRAAFASVIGRLDSANLRIFANLPPSAEEAGISRASVTGTFDAVDCCEDVKRLIRPPQMFSESFPLIDKVANVLADLDCVEQASRCIDSDEFEQLLRLSVERRASEIGAEIRLWHVGNDFYESIERLHLRNDPTVLRALVSSCVNTVLSMQLEQTHHLRRNAGGNSGARTQGDAVAWRRDINYEFHLYYWEARGECELSSVVVHNDFSIPRSRIARLLN